MLRLTQDTRVWMDIKEHFTKSLDVILMNIPYVLLQSICSSLTGSNMLKKGEGKMRKVKSVFLQVVEKPERKVIIKRGKEATEYFQYCEEVGCDVWDAIKKYNPHSIGYDWDDSNPRIQLEPIGTRGYIELHPVKSI